MSQDSVSVVIPCFNARKWIVEALTSVFDQGLAEMQVIVVDDGSTDGSAEVIGSTFPAVQVVRTERAGPSAARDIGTRLSSGAFIQYLDADDLLGVGKLRRQVLALLESGADVAYGDWSELRVGASGGAFAPGRVVVPRLEGDPQIALFTDFWCPPAAYLFRRRIVERVGGWRQDLPVIQDARFALDCALLGGRFIYCPGEAARYRVHHAGSVSTRDPREFTRDCLRNAVSVEGWWEAHGGTTRERHEALVIVYARVARASFDTDRSTFEAACQALERLEPGYLPRHPRSLRLLSRLGGYRRAETLASRYRHAKRAIASLRPQSDPKGRVDPLPPTPSPFLRDFQGAAPLEPSESSHSGGAAQRSPVSVARLRQIARAAYRVPGVKPLARRGLRWSVQRSPLSRHRKQQLHNFLAIDVAPAGLASLRVEPGTGRTLKLRIPVRDDLTRYWYFWGYAHYELGTTRLLRQLLGRKRVFFDVGANLGYFTFLAAALLEGRGAVHAFEPWSVVYDDLATNARLNGFRCLELNQLALGDCDGEARLFAPQTPEWTMASLVPHDPGQAAETVQTMRFDSYCKRRGIDRVDVLKIDVEGAELQVLQGMGNFLSRWQPDIVLEVLEPFEAELDAFFAETPYRKFRIRDGGLEELQRITAEPHDRNIYLSCAP